MKPEHFFIRLNERLDWLMEDFHFLKDRSKAFTAWVLLNHAGVSEDDLVDSVVDGPQDKGIDAIHVPEDGERLLLVQSKLTKKLDSNFSANAIVNTFNGVDWLIYGDLAQVDNVLFRARAEQFREAFLSTFPSVEVIFASTSQGPASDGRAEIEKFENANAPDFIVDVLDVERLADVLRRGLTSTTPNVIDLDLKDPPYERQVGDTRAIVGSVSGDQISALVEAFGNAIFEANIRNYLGSVKINRAIIDTATSSTEAQNFLFYNNGLTFVCDELSFRSAREANHVRLKSAQIVNGCQTATALHEADKHGNLQPATEVFIRIIQRPDTEFVSRVTRSTNSQNAVQAADLVGSDETQRRLAEEFERLGYFYERRRGDFRALYPNRDSRVSAFGDNFSDRVIRLGEAAQAYAAFFVQIPVIAKKNPSYLFREAAEKGRYEEVFGAETTAARIILAVSLYRQIRQRHRQLETYRKSLGKHLSWIPQADMFLLALLNLREFDRFRPDDDDYIKEFHESANEHFEEWYRRLILDVDRYIASRRTRPDYNPPKFFKSERGYLELATAVAPAAMQGTLDV